jgi:Sulfotransferase domain
MSLTVIGAGFGRTGTLSLKRALELLGFGPCYHMVETRHHSAHDAAWLALAKGETTDWRTVLAGYRAIVDWPGIYFWKTLAADSPQARIILTVRDPDRWYDSADKTIFRRMREFTDVLGRGKADTVDPARYAHMRMVNSIVAEGTFGGDLGRDHAIGVFNAHNEEVRRSIPPERLLVYESGEGWDRLCSFLGVPVPQTPYPTVNSAADFNTQFPRND